jgi:hypothetical protein
MKSCCAAVEFDYLRGLDIYQRADSWIQIGASNLDLAPAWKTKVSIFRTEPKGS